MVKSNNLYCECLLLFYHTRNNEFFRSHFIKGKMPDLQTQLLENVWRNAKKKFLDKTD